MTGNDFNLIFIVLQINIKGNKEIQNQAYGNQQNFTDIKLKLQAWFGIRVAQNSSGVCVLCPGLATQCLLLLF